MYYSLGGSVAGLIFFLWYIVMIVQGLMAFGIAYRKTRANGDNGVSLYGWLIVYGFAATIPGLGIYLWKKSKLPEFE